MAGGGVVGCGGVVGNGPYGGVVGCGGVVGFVVGCGGVVGFVVGSVVGSVVGALVGSGVGWSRVPVGSTAGAAVVAGVVGSAVGGRGVTGVFVLELKSMTPVPTSTAKRLPKATRPASPRSSPRLPDEPSESREGGEGMTWFDGAIAERLERTYGARPWLAVPSPPWPPRHVAVC